MRGAPAPPTLFAAPGAVRVRPRRTAAAAANQMPITVTNIGDAPLVGIHRPPTIPGRGQVDGGAATAAPFSVISQAPAPAKTLAAAAKAIADDPTTPGEPGAARGPGWSASVTFGFKPTRTSDTSVARLQFSPPRPTTRWSARRRPGTSTARRKLTLRRRRRRQHPVAAHPGTALATASQLFTPPVAAMYDAATAATVTKHCWQCDAVGDRHEHHRSGRPCQPRCSRCRQRCSPSGPPTRRTRRPRVRAVRARLPACSGEQLVDPHRPDRRTDPVTLGLLRGDRRH